MYTDAVAKDKYDMLPEVLAEKVADEDLRKVMMTMFNAFGTITEALRVELVTVAEKQASVFGDVQLGVDVLADDLMWDVCKEDPLIKEGASEEEPEVRVMHEDGKFSIVWDPLDGSSIVDNNWAVGTILGIWDAKKTGILGATGRDQVCSMVALYGPRTTVYVTLDDGVYEFTYGANGEDGWVCSREKIEIAQESKIFSPANLRAAQEVKGYNNLVDYWMTNRYTMRYTGGLVPDICQQFTKKQGVFANPTSEASPAKLRLAFEAAPFGYLVEKAGGKTSNGIDGASILDTKITGIDQRTPLCIGSACEVDRFNEIVLGKNTAPSRAGSPSMMAADDTTGKTECDLTVGHLAAQILGPQPAARAEAPVMQATDAAFGASHTSMYTDAVAKDKYDMLPEVLAEKVADEDLRKVMMTMFNAFGTITEALRVELVTVAEKQASVFGDVQLGVDVLADDLMWDVCKEDPLIKEGASEEEPEVRVMHEDGKFSIVWDPLDGSSIVDNNWAVGTILGIWDAKKTGILGATGRDQVCSMVALYGPRTTVYVTLDDGVYEFTYGANGEDGWVCSREKIEIAQESKIFSPANLRAAQEVKGYNNLVDYWMTNRYTMRYTGGLVPDICQQFTKKQGVFANPTSEASPAKLRLAFEAAPFGYLVEKAGGKTSNGIDGASILDTKITGIDQRTPLCIGSACEVDRFNEIVLGKDTAPSRAGSPSMMAADDTRDPEEESESKKLLQKVKDAGIAGLISYALWEWGFWVASVPVGISAYYGVTGHFPDLQNPDDQKQLAAEAFAFVNVARFAVPLRIGAALSTTPWVDANVVQKIPFLKKKADEQQKSA